MLLPYPPHKLILSCYRS